MLSYHPDTANLGRQNYYARDWRVVDTNDVYRIATGLTAYAISPSVYEGGRRLKEKFLRADWIALDFDEGVTIAEVLDALCDHIHVLGTTRSHQVPKGDKPACDRFRLFLKLPLTITSYRDYEATVRHYVRQYDADPQCVDAARFFWPCREIISVEPQGYEVDIHEATEDELEESASGPLEEIPPWVKHWLAFGCPAGERNKTCYRTAIYLTKCGYSQREIVEMLMKSPVPIDQSRKVYQEVIYAVRSGARRAMQEMSHSCPDKAGVPND